MQGREAALNMGMYCCCGVRKRDGWKCECDWSGWFLCFENFLDGDAFPKDVPIKKIPEKETQAKT